MDLDGAPAFVLTVVPFQQVGLNLCNPPKTGQLTSPRRALQRAGKHFGK
jgi:hypothetical protein